MKRTINTSLVIAIIIPIALVFWPFAEWNNVMSLVLRVVPSLAVQILLCRVGKITVVKVIPALLTGTFAAWGAYLYFTSPHWSNATIGDIIVDYVSPFICCVVVFIVYVMYTKEKENKEK